MNNDENTFGYIFLDKDSYTLTEVVNEIVARWDLSKMRHDEYGKGRLKSLRKQISRVFDARELLPIKRKGAMRYRQEDVECFLNDADVRKYIWQFKINWQNKILESSGASERKIEAAKKQMEEKANQDIQALVLATAGSVTKEYRENIDNYYIHADDDAEKAKIEVELKIEAVKRQILFQVLSDFVFNDVIEFNEAAYRRDLQDKPDDGDLNPDLYQVLASRRLVDLRNYYKCRSNSSPEKTALTQEIYRILADFRIGIKEDITKVLNQIWER